MCGWGQSEKSLATSTAPRTPVSQQNARTDRRRTLLEQHRDGLAEVVALGLDAPGVCTRMGESLGEGGCVPAGGGVVVGEAVGAVEGGEEAGLELGGAGEGGVCVEVGR